MFTNHWFLAWVTVFFALYWGVGHPKSRRVLIAAFSALFYWHNAGLAGVAPIVVLGGLTYLAGLLPSRPARLAIVAVNIAALVFFKYTLFLAEHLFGQAPAFAQAIVAPLAISFFVFEFCHYLVDVLHGGAPIRSPLAFVNFALFFPTVVAGPIKRYQQFIPELSRGSTRLPLDDITRGLGQVILGLIKKLLIADWLTGYIETWQPHFAGLPPWQRWSIVLAIGFRILFDFSGYSDIAIGLARMLGIRIPANFNWPYLATSVQDFWLRWHISLSSWIRDYVYIPLGGNRHGLGRQAINGLLAFAICGLWHGAAWHFILWGIYHGIGLTISAHYAEALGSAGRAIQRGLAVAFPVRWLLTQSFVFIGWLYFFYPVGQAHTMIRLLLER